MTTDAAGGTETTTQLARERTDLAVGRTYLAAERTLMAWIRTSLSMISFGFTIGKLGDVVHDIRIQGLLRMREYSLRDIAYTLVSMGTFALLVACVQHWAEVRRLRARGLRHQVSIPFIIAMLLTLLGGFALSALVLHI